ncbi:hypothetical protein [Nodosilinea nodulosa]|uniref:hypothetical protein n=1 Tax=Nodosilinea nodulosa TaxID=416001 RepID=UPI00036B3499|nr:hypothetical protein [Nodosilinea nodulosa]
MNDSKALFDYWHSKVHLKNLSIVSSPFHIETYRLRHDCTNYDSLRASREVVQLDELERSRVVAVIKYQCTAQVLQRRAGFLNSHIAELQNEVQGLAQENTRLQKIIRALQEIIFGKDQDIQKLQNRISILETENETFRAEAERAKAYSDLLQEFETLKQEFEKVAKRKQELAKNNQRLGGRVAHTNRFRNERDAARAAAEELRQKLAQVTDYNQQLRSENEALKSELSQLRKQTKLGIVEIRRNGN